MSMIHLRLLLSFAVIDISPLLSDNTSLIYMTDVDYGLLRMYFEIVYRYYGLMVNNTDQYVMISDDSVIYSTYIYIEFVRSGTLL